MTGTIDDNILELFERDKDRAFALLLDQYHERLYWHIRSIVLTHEDANDVSQNTLIKIYNNLDGFKGKSGLYTWMYRIATNEALDFLRKRKRKRTEDMEMHQNEIQSRASDVFVDPGTIEETLIHALEILPEKQKLVFQLRYFGRKTYEEIAEVTQTSIGGLKANFHHAVQKISSYIKEQTIQ